MERQNILSTIFISYRANFGLFWRIMLPVAVIAILLDISAYYRDISLINNHIDQSSLPNANSESHNLSPDLQASKPPELGFSATGNLNTINGIEPNYPTPKIELTTPKIHWDTLPIPLIYKNHSTHIQWTWGLRFKIYDYTPLILLLLTLCPLTLVIASNSPDFGNAHLARQSTSINARDAWKETGKKAFKLFIVFVLFILIIDIFNTIYLVFDLFTPFFRNSWAPTLFYSLVLIPKIYFLVTLSLYNPCLILEDNSIMGIFRRSHSLVRGLWIRFLKTYLCTGWFASILTSVLLGCFLLILSIFFNDLHPFRDALSPLRFLTFFVGGNVEVVASLLPDVLPTVLICIFRGLIFTFLIPIWAIITTQFYLEKSEVSPNLIPQTS